MPICADPAMEWSRNRDRGIRRSAVDVQPVHFAPKVCVVFIHCVVSTRALVVASSWLKMLAKSHLLVARGQDLRYRRVL